MVAMFNIGEFARLGGVSPRMLRHYDAIGLLKPAEVDRYSGYRSYTTEQLHRLNRVVALKDLGFTLEQVHAMVDETVSGEALRGMLLLRRAQLAEQIASDTARLARVEARLRLIEGEGQMDLNVIIKSVPSIRVVETTAISPSFESTDIGPTIQPMYPQMIEALIASNTPFVGPSIAYYELIEPSDDWCGPVKVHVSFPTTAEAAPDGLHIVELRALKQAATVLHHGPMANADLSVQRLAEWIGAHGYQMVGLTREVYLECESPDQSDWITEIQVEIEQF
jgi:DNA-binding transcriptional MerR regulator